MNILRFQGAVARLLPGQSDNTRWIGSPTASDVSFVAQTASHVGEAAAAVGYLTKNGISSRIFLPNPPTGVTRRLRRSFHRSIEAQTQMTLSGLDYGSQLVSVADIVSTSSKLVVFNDWGMPRDLVSRANQHGLETFGWVEGFQDFNNVDLERKELPYRTVQRVLGLVPSENQFFESNQFHLIGSSRLANIEQRQIPYSDRAIDVLVNLNFSYGVSRRYSRQWADKVVRACEANGREVFFTRHPLDKPGWGYRYESVGPLGAVVGDAKTLITRSGTALLDGLAAGCDVIFFNPNFERAAQYLVDEFPDIQEVHTECELSVALSNCSSVNKELRSVGRFSDCDPLELLFSVLVKPD